MSHQSVSSMERDGGQHGRDMVYVGEEKVREREGDIIYIYILIPELSLDPNQLGIANYATSALLAWIIIVVGWIVVLDKATTGKLADIYV